MAEEKQTEANNSPKKASRLKNIAVGIAFSVSSFLGIGHANAQDNKVATPNELGQNNIENIVQNTTTQHIGQDTASVDVFHQAYVRSQINQIQEQGEQDIQDWLDKIQTDEEETGHSQNIEPLPEDEGEIDFMQTPQETYNDVSRNGLSDQEISYAKHFIISGDIDIATLTPEQSVQIASSLQAEELQAFGAEKLQSLADVFIHSYNNGENTDLLAQALKSPLGKHYMAEEGGISLNINTAEQLLASNSINLDNIGMNKTSFLARALDDTFKTSDNQMSYTYDKNNRLRENPLASIAYRYAQNAEIMGQMQESSKLGRYAFDEVFRADKGHELSQTDQTVIANVMQDVINHQNNQSPIGNYNRACEEFCGLTPEAYNAYAATRQSGNIQIYNGYQESINGLTRAFLAEQIQNVHNHLDKSSELAQSESILTKYHIQSCESEKYRALEDLSLATSLCQTSKKEHNFDNITRDYLSGRGYYDRSGLEQLYSQRQIDFVMYLKYQQKGKLSTEEKIDLSQIEQRYGADFLKRSCDYIFAIHNGDLTKAKKARENLIVNDHIRVPAEVQGKIYSVAGMRDQLNIQANKYQKLDNQWSYMTQKLSEQEIDSLSYSLASMAISSTKAHSISSGRTKVASTNTQQTTLQTNPRNQGMSM